MARERQPRAHLAQKTLFNAKGKRTGKEIVLPPLPPPSIEDILYCGPEPDFGAVYFSIYDKLAWHCYGAEKTGHFDADVIKEKANASLQGIKNTAQLTNNKHLLNLFSHLEQLISEHLISPKKLKLKHLKRFLSKKTSAEQEIMDDYSTSVSDEELLPLISAFKKLAIDSQPIEPPLLALEYPKLEDTFYEELEDLGPLPDEFPATLFPDAPKFIYTTSFSKIMAKIEKPHTESQKRPESPSSEDTLSATPTPQLTKKARVEEDRRIAKQLSLGLRVKERKNYQEKPETPKVARLNK